MIQTGLVTMTIQIFGGYFSFLFPPHLSRPTDIQTSNKDRGGMHHSIAQYSLLPFKTHHEVGYLTHQQKSEPVGSYLICCTSPTLILPQDHIVLVGSVSG